MKANAPDKIYLYPSELAGIDYDEEWLESPCGDNSIEYIRTDVFIEKVKEAFCKATCNGHPPRSTCTSLGTCKEHDNFVNYMKGE